MSTVRVTFLGTGDAFSAAGRQQAAYLVAGPTAACLLDCGATTLTALKREQIAAGTVDAVLLSHLHGDHFCGLPFLVLEYCYETRRSRPLYVAGPPGTESRVLMLLHATYPSLARDPLPFPLLFHELEPGVATVVAGLQVAPFRVPHQADEVSLGLRVTVDERTVLYSGDTGWTEELVTQSQGVDLFICECSFFATRTDTHLDYPRLAEHRHRFGARRMLLTHLGREVHARRDEVAIELAHDGLVAEL